MRALVSPAPSRPGTSAGRRPSNIAMGLLTDRFNHVFNMGACGAAVNPACRGPDSRRQCRRPHPEKENTMRNATILRAALGATLFAATAAWAADAIYMNPSEVKWGAAP